MPPKRAPRTEVAKEPAKLTNGDAKHAAEKSAGATRGRPKKEAAPKEPAPLPAAMKTATKKRAPADATEPPPPVAKKAKTAAAAKAPAKAAAKPKAAAPSKAPAKAVAKAPAKRAKTKTPEPAKPKRAINGPSRPRGEKKVINELRHTVPLKVFVFGEGGSGELGLGASKRAIDVKRPRFNETLTSLGVVQVATGGMHCVALTKDNRIITWGVNDNGALGRDTSNAPVKTMEIDEDEDEDEDSDSDSDSGLNEYEATPTAISNEYFPEDTQFVEVSAGDSCSFVLTTEGAVYGWGTFRKNEGILGFAKDVQTAHTPVWIKGLDNITSLACGTNHVLALNDKGLVYAWGNAQANQLGRRVTERSLGEAVIPTHVGFPSKMVGGRRPSKKMVHIVCGDYHSLTIGDDGHVWAWGANNYCETGQVENAGQDNASTITPQLVETLEGKNIQSIASGTHHNLALTESGDVLVWGRCDGSQTGLPMADLKAYDDEDIVMTQNGKPKILLQPTVIPSLKDIGFVCCGPEHSIVIDTSGKAYSWGFSSNYQTGLGLDDDVELPTQIDNTAVRDVKLVFAGAGGQYSLVASETEGGAVQTNGVGPSKSG